MSKNRKILPNIFDNVVFEKIFLLSCVPEIHALRAVNRTAANTYITLYREREPGCYVLHAKSLPHMGSIHNLLAYLSMNREEPVLAKLIKERDANGISKYMRKFAAREAHKILVNNPDVVSNKRIVQINNNYFTDKKGLIAATSTCDDKIVYVDHLLDNNIQTTFDTTSRSLRYFAYDRHPFMEYFTHNEISSYIRANSRVMKAATHYYKPSKCINCQRKLSNGSFFDTECGQYFCCKCYVDMQLLLAGKIKSSCKHICIEYSNVDVTDCVTFAIKNGINVTFISPFRSINESMSKFATNVITEMNDSARKCDVFVPAINTFSFELGDCCGEYAGRQYKKGSRFAYYTKSLITGKRISTQYNCRYTSDPKKLECYRIYAALARHN